MKKKLVLRPETIRVLTDMAVVRGVGTNAIMTPTGAPATNGDTACKSEATGCATFAVGWSCINASCC